jgi:dihydrofolate reductase
MVVAADDDDMIGRDGVLPWHVPEDLRRFRALTTGHVVIAGRITHESIVERLGRPLPDRTTVVVTRDPSARPAQATVVYEPDLSSALERARLIAGGAGQDEVFVIGGAELYRQALPQVRRVHLTRIAGHFGGDRALPAGWLDPFTLTHDDGDRETHRFLTYERV